MTEKEFIKLIEEYTFYYLKPKDRQWERDTFVPTSAEKSFWGSKPRKARKVTLEDCYLFVEWSTGGISGGSCWDTRDSNPHHHYTSDNQEPDLYPLDEILEKVCPNLTFLQYKKLAKLIKVGNRTESEYYGNTTDYSYKYLLLKDLFDFIQGLEKCA